MYVEESRQRWRHTLLLRSVKLTNVILMTAAYGVVWYLAYAQLVMAPFWRRGNWAVIALFFVFYLWNGRVYQAFLISYNQISEMIYSQVLSLGITNILMYVITWLLTQHRPPVWPLLISFGVEILIAALWSAASHYWYFKVFPPKKTVIVWDERQGLQQLIEDYHLDIKFAVTRKLSVKDCLSDPSQMRQAEAVFLIGVHSTDRNVLLKYCVAQGISAYVIPRVGDVLMSSAKRMHLFHLPILRVDRYSPAVEYTILKRLFDIVMSVLALLVTSPVSLVTAIAIKAEDGGPILYRQERLTMGGKLFRILKFRSMKVDAEKDGIARLSGGEGDERVTRVGRFIRRNRIDEIPQFLNILRGDMSIVGPRPERPEIAERLEKELPEFRLRLQARAGLTGYAQVYGKYNTTPYDKLLLDLMYLAKPSIGEDIKIMLATIKILAMKISTEGVRE